MLWIAQSEKEASNPRKTTRLRHVRFPTTRRSARQLTNLGSQPRTFKDGRVIHKRDPLEQIKSGLDREMGMNQLDVQVQLFQDVRAALDAVDDGTYGFCERRLAAV